MHGKRIEKTYNDADASFIATVRQPNGHIGVGHTERIVGESIGKADTRNAVLLEADGDRWLERYGRALRGVELLRHEHATGRHIPRHGGIRECMILYRSGASWPSGY